MEDITAVENAPKELYIHMVWIVWPPFTLAAFFQQSENEQFVSHKGRKPIGIRVIQIYLYRD